MIVMDVKEAERLTKVFYGLMYTQYKDRGECGNTLAIERLWQNIPFECVVAEAKRDYYAYQALGHRIVKELEEGRSLSIDALELIKSAFEDSERRPNKKTLIQNYRIVRDYHLMCCCIYMLEKFGYPDIVGDTNEYNPNTACSIVASKWEKKSDTVRKIYAKITEKDKREFDRILDKPEHQNFLFNNNPIKA